MNTETDWRHRHSIRYQGYDYRQDGAYFVTICTRDRGCVLGDVVEGQVQLSEIGEIAESAWHGLGRHLHDVVLDAFVVMPNHVHGVLWLRHAEPDVDGHGIRRRLSLADVVRSYKSLTTRAYWRANPVEDSERSSQLWQRNYYERIVRNERELGVIREYIALNPGRWSEDRENLAHIP